MKEEDNSLSETRQEILSWDRDRKSRWSGLRPGRIITGIGAAAAIAIILLLAVSLVGAYRWGWENSAARAATRVLRLAVAELDGLEIRWPEYYREKEALAGYYRSLPAADRPSPEELGSLALESLAEKAVIAALAGEHEVSITDEESDFRLKNVFGVALADPQALEAMLRKTYGFGLEDYRQLVVLPVLQREALAELIQVDERIQAASVDEMIAQYKNAHDVRVFAK